MWMSGVRLLLWVMCTTDTVGEYTTVGWWATIASDDRKPPMPIPDKAMLPLHIIYAGFPKLPKGVSLKDFVEKGTKEMEGKPQPYHTDIDMTPVEGSVGTEELKKRSTPHSMLIALQDKRRIRFANKSGGEEAVEIEAKDEILFFPAKSTHAGDIYGKDEVQSLHLGLHVEIDSELIEWEKKDVLLDMKAIASLQPYYMDRFPKDSLVDQVDGGVETLVKVLNSTLKSGRRGSAVVPTVASRKAVVKAVEKGVAVLMEKVRSLKAELEEGGTRKRKAEGNQLGSSPRKRAGSTGRSGRREVKKKGRKSPPGEKFVMKIVKGRKDFVKEDVEEAEAFVLKEVSSQILWGDLVKSIQEEHGSCWQVTVWKRTAVDREWTLGEVGLENCKIVVMWDGGTTKALGSKDDRGGGGRGRKGDDDDSEGEEEDERKMQGKEKGGEESSVGGSGSGAGGQRNEMMKGEAGGGLEDLVEEGCEKAGDMSEEGKLEDVGFQMSDNKEGEGDHGGVAEDSSLSVTVAGREEPAAAEARRPDVKVDDARNSKGKMTIQSCLKFFGLPLDASVRQVRAKYKQLALQHHTDRGGSKEVMQVCNEVMNYLEDHIVEINDDDE